MKESVTLDRGFCTRSLRALKTKTIATATKKIRRKMIDGKTVLRG